MTPAKLRAQIEEYRPYFRTPATKDLPIGVQSPANWKKTLQDMENAGVVPAGTAPEKYFTNDFIDVNLAQSFVKG